MKSQISAEIAKKIRHLELKTRKLLQGYYIGEHRAAQKGYGLEFEQLSEYQYGHDVRFIDWKSSARMNKLLVREYKDERTRSIIIAFDTSASSFFGAQHSKSDIMIDIATILMMAGLYSKDMVGLILFNQDVETYIPPGKSRQHLELLLRTICQVKPGTKKTSVKNALDYIARLKRRDAMVFVLSDMIDTDFEKALRIVSTQNDCIILRTLDPLEKIIPSVGFVEAVDCETHQKIVLNLQGSALKRSESLIKMFHDEKAGIIKSCGADLIDIQNTEKIVEQLVRFFQKRTSR
jgi:uncharacterized protein (DUF58 family)